MFRFFAIIVMMMASSCVLAQGFSGRVVDSLTKTGIPSASVFLVDYGVGVQTNENGVFQFEGSFSERLNVKVSVFEYETKFLEIQINQEIVIGLLKLHIDMEEVVVSGARQQLQKYSVTHVERRSMESLNEIPVTNLGQAIETIPGVFNSSTGNGISKPVIRGLQGTRVISLLNGIRIENQQWGGDHGMGLTDLGIGTVEVIKGPASLIYGADALGGVLYFSDEPYALQKTHELKFSSQFESNTLGTINTLFYKGSVKGLRINVGGRFNSQADFQMPSGRYVKNSRFQESAGKISLGWSKGKWISNLKYNFSTARLGLVGHTHDTILSPELFKTEKQLREKTLPVQYFTNHILSFDNKFLFGKSTLDVLLSATRNDLLEFEEKVTIPGLGLVLQNALYQVKMSTKLKKRFLAVYGIQGMVQNQNNDTKAEERLLPNAFQNDIGAYGNLYVDWKKVRLQVGLRFDSRTMESQADDEHFPLGFKKNFTGFNYVVGGVYNIKRQTVRLNISSGFRIPHLSELLSNGVHHGALRYEIGDANLRPEKATQLDLTYEFRGDHLSLIINPFVSSIADYISINPTDSVIDGNPVFQYGQIDNSQLVGIDAGIHYHPHFAHFLHVESSYSYLRGTAFNSGNLSLMPQPRINNSLIARLSMKTKLKISEIVFQHQYYFPQNEVVSFETTSSDYSLFHLGMNVETGVKMPLKLQFGIRNLTNTGYINHLSRLKNIGLESPGRNIYIKLNFKIKYDEKK